jgi:glycosyltransferase involved in cell wall biosynthesis
VAPLRYGAGLKGKVISSLSYGVPVVATRVAAEGGGFVDGENVLLADDTDMMAERIMQVYADRELWTRLSRNGLAYFVSAFSVEAVAGKLRALLDAVSGPRR